MFLPETVLDSFSNKVEHSTNRRIDAKPGQKNSNLSHKQIRARSNQ